MLWHLALGLSYRLLCILLPKRMRIIRTVHILHQNMDEKKRIAEHLFCIFGILTIHRACAVCVCIGYKWISILIAVTNSFNIHNSIDSENQMRCVTTTDVITSRCGENEWFWLIPFMTAQFTSSFTWLFAFPHFDMRHQLKYDVFFLSINFNSKGAMKFFAVYCTNLLENKDEHFYFHEFSKVDF